MSSILTVVALVAALVFSLSATGRVPEAPDGQTPPEGYAAMHRGEQAL